MFDIEEARGEKLEVETQEIQQKDSKDIIEKAYQYTKSKPAYERILQEIRKKYITYGRFTGTIEMREMSVGESELLSPINHGLYRKKQGKFKVKDFSEHFVSLFPGLDFHLFLEKYFHQPLIHKKERQSKEEEKRSLYFQKLISKFENSIGGRWLTYALEKQVLGYEILMVAYQQDSSELQKVLEKVLLGLDFLSQRGEEVYLLPIFASQITTNPHFFDSQKIGGKLLQNALCYGLQKSPPQNAEEMTELLYQGGIIRDEISNYTVVYGVDAYTKNSLKETPLQKEQCKHKGWEAFFDRGEPLQVNLQNLKDIEHITANSNRVYIFENPSVFSAVLEATKRYKPSLVCTHGQVKLASLLLLDKLVHSGTILYYSGDMDPEGVQIAHKLKQRYQERLVLWRWSKEEYLKIKGETEFSDQRRAKIQNIDSIELHSVIQTMGLHGVCGYQELLIETYIKDISSNFSSKEDKN